MLNSSRKLSDAYLTPMPAHESGQLTGSLFVTKYHPMNTTDIKTSTERMEPYVAGIDSMQGGEETWALDKVRLACLKQTLHRGKESHMKSKKSASLYEML